MAEAAAQTVGDTRFGGYFRPGFVHRELYTSPEIFAEEMRTLFGGTWVYVAHESEIPAPNDYVTRRIGRRPVIVCRTADDRLVVLMNRCTHRGALVCRQDHGNASRFICGYHAWAFGNDGSCTGVPLRQAYGDDFKLSDQNLGRAPRVESYRGFIFASLNRALPPLVEHLAGARRYLDDWLDRNGGQPVLLRASAHRFRCQTNWKCVYDNAGDGYHPPFSHVSMLTVFQKRYGDVDLSYYRTNFDKFAFYGKPLGNGHTTLDQRPMMHAESAWKRQHPHPSREPLEAALIDRHGEEQAIRMLDDSTGSGLNLNIFPNLMIIGNQVQLLEPISVNETVIHWYATVLADADPEINAIRMRMQEDFPSLGEVDDAANFESCQTGMESVPEMEWIDIRRHMTTGAGSADDDGGWKSPMSSDFHLRTYFEQWRHLMEQGAKLELAY
jgi:phenylpropionate dioxygenase-like ring-hydroxylating dioxygenase large terminal subunit